MDQLLNIWSALLTTELQYPNFWTVSNASTAAAPDCAQPQNNVIRK